MTDEEWRLFRAARLAANIFIPDGDRHLYDASPGTPDGPGASESAGTAPSQGAPAEGHVEARSPSWASLATKSTDILGG